MNITEKIYSERKELSNIIITGLKKEGLNYIKGLTGLRPQNPLTNKNYKGGNSLKLMAIAEQKKYNDPRWVTYKQAQEEGWQVKKDSKGVLLEKWLFEREIKDEKGNISIKKYDKPFQNYFIVFNGNDIDNIPPFIEPEKLNISHYGVVVNQLEKTYEKLNELDKTDKERYSKEELKTEFSSLFISKDIGNDLNCSHIENQKSDINSWIKVLENNPNEIYNLSVEAERITDRIFKEVEGELKITIEFTESNSIGVQEENQIFIGKDAYNLLERMIDYDKDFGLLQKAKSKIETSLDDGMLWYEKTSLILEHKGYKKEMRIDLGDGEFGGKDNVLEGLKFRLDSWLKELEENIDFYSKDSKEEIKKHILTEKKDINKLIKYMKDEKFLESKNIQKEYSDDGKLAKKIYENGQCIRTVKYNENGELTTYEETRNNINRQYYLEKGRLEKFSMVNQVNEVENHKSYHENGKLKSEYLYSDEQKDIKRYDENGKLEELSTFLRGKKDGLYIKNTKTVVYEGVYVNNKYTGIIKKYNENGKPKETLNYKNGKGHGLYSNYFENGQLEYEANYKNGALNGSYKLFSEKNILILEGNYKNNNREGVFKSYSKNGQLESEVNYKNGIKEPEKSVTKINSNPLLKTLKKQKELESKGQER